MASIKAMLMKRGFPVLIVVVFLVAGFYSYRSLGINPASASVLAASGTIESEQAVVSAEVSGRILEIMADEGRAVRRGDPVALIDDAILNARLNEAEAAVEVAKARLAQIKAGASDEAVAVARAALIQAQTMERGARSAQNDVKIIRHNPQELNAKIDIARAQLEAATHALNQAAANNAAAKEMKDLAAVGADVMENGVNVTINVGGKEVNRTIGFGPADIEKARLERTLASHRWWTASEQVNLAQAQKDAAEANLRNLLEMKEHPLQLDAQVNAADARYKEAAATASAANAQLKTILNGATPEDLAFAQAQVDQAQAAADLLRVQKAKTVLTSPISGFVTKRSANLGEMATPGLQILSIANLERVTLTIYIPESSIGQVHIGQKITVNTDSFRNMSFAGEVTYISDKAEFTPKNVQTEKERVNTVYAVKTILDNPAGQLKPGMPVDALIEVAR